MTICMYVVYMLEFFVESEYFKSDLHIARTVIRGSANTNI